MIRGEKVYSVGGDLNEEGKAINITRATDIYCGRPTAGYQVVRVGLDVTFAPDLVKVYALIEEYYNGQGSGFHREEMD